MLNAWKEQKKKRKIISCELNWFDTRIQSWNFFLRIMSCKNDEYCFISHHWFDTMDPKNDIQCKMARNSRKKAKSRIRWIELIRQAYLELKHIFRSNIVWKNLISSNVDSLIWSHGYKYQYLMLNGYKEQKKSQNSYHVN